MTDHRLPARVESRLRELQRQLRRRSLIRGLTRFALAFAASTAALGLGLHLSEGLPVPPVVPVIVYLLLLAAAWLRWVRRAAIPVSRERLALFLDEHHPELEHLFVTGETLGRRREAAPGSAAANLDIPDWLLDRFFERTRAETRRVALPTLVTADGSRRQTWTCLLSGLLGVATLLAVMPTIEVDLLQKGFFTGWQTAGAFTVEPGDARVVQGASQTVWVRTGDGDAGKAIRWRGTDGDWRTDALQPSRSPEVYYHLFDGLYVDTEYQVQVGRARSGRYRLTVWTPPAVERVDVTCRYPAYLGVEPRSMSFDRKLEVPEGSVVELEVTVNKPLASVRISGRTGNEQPLGLRRAAPHLWSGELVATGVDSLRITLEDEDGETVQDPRVYVLTAREDLPPEMRIRLPRGDDEATSIEEISFSFQVSDDRGLTDYGLQYEIVGQDPVRLSLRSDDAPTGGDVNHVLALESLDLEAGDFLTWSVWAQDRKPGRDPFDLLGDPYLLEIRPFSRRYAQAVADRGGQRGGGGGGSAQRQKQVMIATWNLRKESTRLGADAFEEHRGGIVEAQLEVIEQAEADPSDPRTAQLLAQLREDGLAAVEKLRQAGPPDPRGDLSDALRHEQRVYRAMRKLEPELSRVTRAGNGSGGGGESGARQGEVDALELAARRDFREQASTLDERMAETERTRSRIEDLARRQEAINEDLARLISEQPKDAETTPEAQRQLEQLLDAQRRNLAQLDRVLGDVASRGMDADAATDARGRLQEAREQMAAGAAGIEAGQLQRSRAAGNRAHTALDQVGDRLQQLSRAAAAEGMRQLEERMGRLQDDQRAIVDRVRERAETGGAQRLEESDAAADALLQAKRDVARGFRDFMDEAGTLAERTGASQELMSQRLGDWLRETAGEGIYEDIQKGERAILYGAWDAARPLEESVSDRLEQAGEGLRAVAGNIVGDDLVAVRRAVEELESLLREGPGSGAATGDDLRRWDDGLRTAEALLPRDLDARRGIESIREALAGIERQQRRGVLLPHQEIVVDAVFGPLAETVKQLRDDLDRRMSEHAVSSTGQVPERYREAVAEYFRQLSEMDR